MTQSGQGWDGGSQKGCLNLWGERYRGLHGGEGGMSRALEGLRESDWLKVTRLSATELDLPTRSV